MLNERQRVIAQALLQRRLRNLLRVDDDLYFDTSLITHIEYQLFLDEQRNEGKFCQPDHWQCYDFPNGQAHLPVVGVRPSDAQAFCAWLTQHASDNVLAGWQFRLPWVDETKHHHMEFVRSANAYWVQRIDGFVVETFGGSLPEVSTTILKQRIDSVRGLDRARALALARSRARALDHTFDRGLDLDLARALDSALARDIDRDLALARSLGRDLDRDIDLALALALDRALDLDRVLARERDLARDRSFVRATYLAVALLLQTNKVKKVVAFCQQVLDIYVDLVVLEERIVGNLPAFEGILLVKERKADD